MLHDSDIQKDLDPCQNEEMASRNASIKMWNAKDPIDSYGSSCSGGPNVKMWPFGQAATPGVDIFGGASNCDVYRSELII